MCVWISYVHIILYRLVKQLVEVPSCHVTTLKLAGNTLQVWQKKVMAMEHHRIFNSRIFNSYSMIHWWLLWPLWKRQHVMWTLTSQLGRSTGFPRGWRELSMCLHWLQTSHRKWSRLAKLLPIEICIYYNIILCEICIIGKFYSFRKCSIQRNVEPSSQSRLRSIERKRLPLPRPTTLLWNLPIKTVLRYTQSSIVLS